MDYPTRARLSRAAINKEVLARVKKKAPLSNRGPEAKVKQMRYVVASSKNGHRLIRVLQCLVPDTF